MTSQTEQLASPCFSYVHFHDSTADLSELSAAKLSEKLLHQSSQPSIEEEQYLESTSEMTANLPPLPQVNLLQDGGLLLLRLKEEKNKRLQKLQ